MKKGLFLILFACLILTPFNNKAYAEGAGAGYKYIDGGYLYSNVSVPLAASKEINLDPEKSNTVYVSNKYKNSSENRENLKHGASSRTNILWLVEWGNAGIYQSAKNGKINQIHYIEITREKLFVPLGFIPVYFDRYITHVYGE